MDQVRSDGRESNASLRPLSCEISCLSAADGSCILTCGNTEVLVAIYGPVSPRSINKENYKEVSIAVIFKHMTKSGASNATNNTCISGYGANERELERFIGESVSNCIIKENYPRSVIEIVIQVIKSDGSVLSSCVNATAIALMDAGIPMLSLPIATTCILKSSTNEIAIDPTSEEESTINSNNTTMISVLVIDSIKLGLICTMSFGTISSSTLFLNALDISINASTKAILAFMKMVIEQKCKRESLTLWSS